MALPILSIMEKTIRLDFFPNISEETESFTLTNDKNDKIINMYNCLYPRSSLRSLKKYMDIKNGKCVSNYFMNTF